MKFEKAKADYDANGAEYTKQWDQYDQEMQKYSSDYNTALAKYNTEQREAFPNSRQYRDWKTRDQLFEDYYGSKEYSKYNEALESWKKRKAIPKNVWDWVKNHPLGVGLGAWWLGDKLFGGSNNASITTKNPPVKGDSIEPLPALDMDSIVKAVTDTTQWEVSQPDEAPPRATDQYYTDDENNNP